MRVPGAAAVGTLVLLAALAGAAAASPADQAADVGLKAAEGAAVGARPGCSTDWATIDAPRKQKWIEIAGRFPRCSRPSASASRERDGRMGAHDAAPSAAGARLQFQELRQFSPEDRQARWEEYKALPDDERRELARRAHPQQQPQPRSVPPGDLHGSDVVAKRNVVPSGGQPSVKPVAPTLVQARPGATTSLMSAKPPWPAAHQQPGLPTIAATEGFVDPTTLLPQRGPQGAAAASAEAASAPPTRHR